MFHFLELLLTWLALNWLGMWFGLTTRRLVTAVGLTLGSVLGSNLLIHLLIQSGLRLGFSPNRGPETWLFWSFAAYPIACGVLLALTAWARRQLHHPALGEALDPFLRAAPGK